MRQFQERKKIKKRIYSKPVVIALIIILALLIQATWKIYLKERESAANLAKTENQLNLLKSRSNVLSEDLNKLTTNQGVEGEIRSKYEVAKSGEQVIVIVDKNTATSSAASGNIFERWWRHFLDLFKKK